jgi:hypothetical protein
MPSSLPTCFGFLSERLVQEVALFGVSDGHHIKVHLAILKRGHTIIAGDETARFANRKLDTDLMIVFRFWHNRIQVYRGVTVLVLVAIEDGVGADVILSRLRSLLRIFLCH